MTVIREEDLITSVAVALQYISYFHPMDYIPQIKIDYLHRTLGSDGYQPRHHS